MMSKKYCRTFFLLFAVSIQIMGIHALTDETHTVVLVALQAMQHIAVNDDATIRGRMDGLNINFLVKIVSNLLLASGFADDFDALSSYTDDPLFGTNHTIDSCMLESFYDQRQRRPDLLPRSAYERILLPPEETIARLRVQDQGPLSMQGIFWLDQTSENQDEIVSFARTDEGSGLSTGVLSESNEYTYRNRVLGDQTWATKGHGENLRPGALSNGLDMIVNWQLVEGTIAAPEKFQVVVDMGIPLTCRRVELKGCLGVESGLLDWYMVLENTPSTVDDGKPAHPDYPTSFVWNRRSNHAIPRLDFEYSVIQLIDGNGNRLQPAYDAWLKESLAYGEEDSIYVMAKLKNETAGPVSFWNDLRSCQ